MHGLHDVLSVLVWVAGQAVAGDGGQGTEGEASAAGSQEEQEGASSLLATRQHAGLSPDFPLVVLIPGPVACCLSGTGIHPDDVALS